MKILNKIFVEVSLQLSQSSLQVCIISYSSIPSTLIWYSSPFSLSLVCVKATLPPSLPLFLPSPCSSSVCLHSLDPERKFLSVFVNDKLINNSSTRAAPSGPRFQGDRRKVFSDWSADVMYPMKRLPIVAIQQPGAAESTSSQSLQRVYSHRRQEEGGNRRHPQAQNIRAWSAWFTSRDTSHLYSTFLLWISRKQHRGDRARSRGVI